MCWLIVELEIMWVIVFGWLKKGYLLYVVCVWFDVVWVMLLFVLVDDFVFGGLWVWEWGKDEMFGMLILFSVVEFVLNCVGV